MTRPIGYQGKRMDVIAVANFHNRQGRDLYEVSYIALDLKGGK